MTGMGGQAAFELSPPPMIGLLPATTVVYILLGLGALLPILLLTVVAVTLCVRRRSRTSSSGDLAVDEDANACRADSIVGFDVDLSDDVFAEKAWTTQRSWNAKRRMASNRLKRMLEMVGGGGNVEVQHSSNNPNVYFRSAGDAGSTQKPPPTPTPPPAPATDIERAVRRRPSDDIVRLRPGQLYALSGYWTGDTSPPSCDVTVTSSSRSDVGVNPITSGNSPTSMDSTRDVTLDRHQSTTLSTLQQEEERVLRYERFAHYTTRSISASSTCISSFRHHLKTFLFFCC